MLNVSGIKSQMTWCWHVDSSRLLLEYFYDLANLWYIMYLRAAKLLEPWLSWGK